MMRRNLEGKLDGDGIKRGDATEIAVTIVAPFVVGAASAPKTAPQSLGDLGGFPNLVVKQGKWDFFFGRGIKPDPHNTPRSLQNKMELDKLGILDDVAGQKKLLDLFEEGLKLSEKSRKTSEFGITVTKHVKVSKIGGIDVKYFYPNGNMNAKPQISTIIPKIYEYR